MKPKRIILIRHGESEGNVNKEAYAQKPDYTLQLSLRGFAQAMEAGTELKTIVGNETMHFYVSPMWRTRMTFEQIYKSFNEYQVSYIEEPRLREQEWGHLRGAEESKKIDKIRDEYGVFYYRIPEGESGADVFDRVSDFFGTLHRDFEKSYFPDNAVLVTHGMAIRLFLMRWFHWTVEEFEEYANLKNCEMVILEKNEFDKYILKTELRKHEVKNQHQRPIALMKLESNNKK